MEYICLNEVCSIKTGKLDANASTIDGKYPFFTCSKEILKIDNYSYDCECVLVAGNGDLNVKYYNGKFDAYQRTYIIEVKNKEEYNTLFIYYLIQSKIEDLKKQSIGAVIKYIKLNHLTSIKVPKIDIQEQIKIVEILNNYKKLMTIKEKQKSDIDCLINSKFIELFGNPIKNERNWNKYLLSELGTLKNGMNYSKESQNYKIKFLGVSEFKYGDIINDSSYLQDLYLTEKPEQISLLKNNDILFVRSNGSKDLVGRSLIFVDIEEDVTFSGFCIRFRNESKLINPRFLIKLFQNEEFKKSLKKDSRGANINNINQQMLSNLPIIVPPLELQNNFVDLVMNLEQIKIIIDKNSNELDTLYIKKVSEYFN